MVEVIDIVATAATVWGVIASLAYFVQAAKIWKNKSARDVSLITFIAFSIVITLWLLYGILLNNMPLIIANSVGIIGAYIVVGLILKFRKS